MRKKIQKRLFFMMLMLVAFVTMPLISFADENPPTSGNLGNPLRDCIDIKYRDHGLVNTNGTKVMTKNYSFITNSWNDRSERAISMGDYGVIIDNYLFYIKDDSNGEFIVKDRNSGVEKKLDFTIPDVATVGTRYVYTVLKGFEDGNPYYSILVYSHKYAGIQWYKFQPDSAFTKAEETIKAEKIFHWKAWENASSDDYKFLSLIRVPSLLSDKSSNDFCNNDFAIAVFYHKGNPNILYFNPLEWNKCAYDKLFVKADYRPKVSYKHRKPGCAWIHYQGYVNVIDAISGTAYINEKGEYSVQVSANCWGNVKGDIGQPEKFAAMKMMEFVVNCHKEGNSQFYTIEYKGSNDKTLVNIGDSENIFYEGHYAVASTWAVADGDNRAKQVRGFVSPFNRKVAEFYSYGKSTGSIYDWSEKTLKEYGVKSDFAKANTKTGEGLIVQGMVLSVPPHPELYKNILKSSVKIENSISCTEWNGTKSSIENTTTLECSACTPVVSFSSSASSSWSRDKDSQESKTFSTGSSTQLSDYRENLIFGIRPEWEAKSAVLKGSNNENVRYANSDNNTNAYVTIAAVMGKGTSFTQIQGITADPGKNMQGQQIVLTEGMQQYAATKSGSDDDGELYDDYIGMLSNLKGLANKKIISQKVITDVDLNSRSDNQSIWFNANNLKEASCSSTGSVSVSLSVGGKIANISNETTASITKSYGSSFSEEKGCAFSYFYEGDKEKIKYHHKIQPVIYWIPVSELRSKYKTRTDDVDLRFIPDYMWNNMMDYWLFAYQIVGEAHNGMNL